MGMAAVVGLGVEGGGCADDGEEGCYSCGLHGYSMVQFKLWGIQMDLNYEVRDVF